MVVVGGGVTEVTADLPALPRKACFLEMGRQTHTSLVQTNTRAVLFA